MAIRSEFAPDFVSNDSLQVWLTSTIDDAIDSISAKRKFVEKTFISATTYTHAVGAEPTATGFGGTTLLLIHITSTSTTVTSGGIVVCIQKLLPNGTYTDVARYDVTTNTARTMVVKAEPSAGSVAAITDLGIASGTVVDGPWGDTLKCKIYFNGTTAANTTTLTVKAYAY